MIQIIDTRGTGKTSRLLLLAKETDATVVSFDPISLREKASYYGISGVKMISYKELFYSDYDKNIHTNFLIDELESYVAYSLALSGSRSKLAGYSLSKENYNG